MDMGFGAWSSIFSSIDNKFVSPIRNEDFGDYHNKREISRQRDFLAGVAQPSGEAQNTYMDAAYPGTSPWEQLGAHAAAPLPNPDVGNASSSTSQFLNNMTAIRQAEIQQDTALQVAKTNQETQLQTTAMQTGNAKAIADQSTNNGELPKADTALRSAQKLQSESQTLLNETSASLANNTALLNTIDTLMRSMPTVTTDFGIVSTTEKQGWEHILSLGNSLDDGDPQYTRTAKLAKRIAAMSDSETKQLTRDALMVAGLIGKAAKGGAALASDAGSLFKKGKDFLSNFGANTAKNKAGPMLGIQSAPP